MRVVSVLLLALLVVVLAVGVTSAAPKLELITDDQVYFVVGGALSQLVVKDDLNAKILSFLTATFYELGTGRESWEHGLLNAILFNGGRHLFKFEF